VLCADLDFSALAGNQLAGLTKSVREAADVDDFSAARLK